LFIGIRLFLKKGELESFFFKEVLKLGIFFRDLEFNMFDLNN